ncbi:MAG: hypothetical protein JWO86_5635 [Myxococcaceae bacterium]|nr:hypothetical protein [Myxococcaceae bacterium]
MDKVAVRVSGDPSFFDEVTTEAARLDRSPSWLLGFCLGTTLPKLASSIVVAEPRNDVRHPGKRKMWTFFVPRELIEHCGRLAARLGMSSDDVLAYAWEAGRDTVRALPSS